VSRLVATLHTPDPVLRTGDGKTSQRGWSARLRVPPTPVLRNSVAPSHSRPGHPARVVSHPRGLTGWRFPCRHGGVAPRHLHCQTRTGGGTGGRVSVRHACTRAWRHRVVSVGTATWSVFRNTRVYKHARDRTYTPPRVHKHAASCSVPHECAACHASPGRPLDAPRAAPRLVAPSRPSRRLLALGACACGVGSRSWHQPVGWGGRGRLRRETLSAHLYRARPPSAAQA
jgi:hypothetical protein